MKRAILIYKKEGETPLEALERFRRRAAQADKKYESIKMTYAGRLDPMASGLLLVLTGEEVKNKEKYLALEKEYEFEVLVGFSTDTFDILGKVVSTKKYNLHKKQLEVLVQQNLEHFMGKFAQKYPMYSSKTVKGKQLFTYARRGESVKIPSREVRITSLKVINSRTISHTKLLSNIEKRVKKVKGDFRQKEILAAWKKYLRTSTLKSTVVKFKIKCSSGTYVRGIANTLGEKIGIPALAFTITRTKIGKWNKPHERVTMSA